MPSDFLFYYGTDEGASSRVRRAARSHWGEIREIQVDAFWLFISSSHYESSFGQSSNSIGAISGYVRIDDLEHSTNQPSPFGANHNQLFVANIVKDDSWPLGEQWTGSFSAVAYSSDKREVLICNDLIGSFPIYYALENENLIGGTSLIGLSHCLDSEVDVVGTLQRITSPYCNYGRRTLLKEVSRLLPGESLKFSSNGRVKSVFDNSLCRGVLDGDADSIARTVWDCLQREISLAAGLADHLCVGMSGGWDSRLVLRGIAHTGRTIDCYSYGGEDLYETQLARSCAQAVGASHQSFSIEDRYFPPKSDLGALVKKTEAANYMVWFTIIDSLKERGQSTVPILLGDYCESIDGRNISTLSSRRARIESFVTQLMGKETQIPAATTKAFHQWKEEKQRRLIKDILGNLVHLSPDLANGISEELLIRELQQDLELSFSRVRDNLPAFAPMFDELFTWFHRARYLGASQPLLLSSLFRPISPADSVRFLRLISTVHPRLRLRRRLMDALARLPEFDALAEIPSAQIPWLGARSSTLLRELVWGLRSNLDQLLIRRVMRSKSPTKRQRVLRSLDYVKEYRREGVVTTVREWFSGKWVNPEQYIETINHRSELSSWPLINLDIAAPANVSMILDLCDL